MVACLVVRGLAVEVNDEQAALGDDADVPPSVEPVEDAAQRVARALVPLRALWVLAPRIVGLVITVIGVIGVIGWVANEFFG